MVEVFKFYPRGGDVTDPFEIAIPDVVDVVDVFEIHTHGMVVRVPQSGDITALRSSLKDNATCAFAAYAKPREISLSDQINGGIFDGDSANKDFDDKLFTVNHTLFSFEWFFNENGEYVEPEIIPCKTTGTWQYHPPVS